MTRHAAQAGFDREACLRVYRAQLEPAFRGHPQAPSLDERNLFYLRMLVDAGGLIPDTHLVDLGAGLSIFGPMAPGLGLRVTLIDDFGGGGGVRAAYRTEDLRLLTVFREQLGIAIVEANFLEQPLPMETGTVDAVTCFHSLEHWHHSPKRLFREITRALRPGGVLILATPNAVNIRKRFYVLLGKNNFPGLREWYEEGDPIFRGHVREPVIRDLHQLLRWNGFTVVATHGRNFIGRDSKALAFLPKPLVRALAIGSDVLLRFFPSLCSDIHVVGRKQP